MVTENMTPAPAVDTAAERASGVDDDSSRFAVPGWANDIGRWSGVIILVVVVIALLFLLLAATRVLFLAVLFAVLFGGTFLPIVDWLAKHHIKRGLAAMLVAVFLVLLGVGIGAIIVFSIVKQVPTIDAKLESAWTEIEKSLKSTSVSQSSVDSVKSGVQELAKNAASGLAGTLVRVVGGAAQLIFCVFISLNILVWILLQGRQLGRWASKRAGPVPEPVAYDILASSARFFRGYIYGSTLVGLFNGGVMFVGALVIGVPLAATIGIVGWFTNYIPFFGAIISGAFAVLIALGAGGPSKAIPMLVIVIISNGYLQTVVSQFALGSALRLHPLAVLFATTAGSALFGAVGGVFAAPFLKIFLDARLKMKAAGLFSNTTAADPAETGPPSSTGAGPPGLDETQGPPSGSPHSVPAQT